VISEIQQAADDVAVLRAGRIVDVSTVERLRAAARRSVRVTVRTADRDAVLARLNRVPQLEVVTVVELDGSVVVHGLLGDGVAAFVAAVSASDVLDLVVQEPDLESAVLGFYGPSTEKEEER
jgi:ABC-2 type transport system ATP-binding protein